MARTRIATTIYNSRLTGRHRSTPVAGTCQEGDAMKKVPATKPGQSKQEKCPVAAYLVACTLCGLAVLWPTPPAGAADVVTEPFPGVRYVQRHVSEPRQIDMHVVVIDLNRPGVTIKTTGPNDDRPGHPHRGSNRGNDGGCSCWSNRSQSNTRTKACQHGQLLVLVFVV